MNNTKDEIQHSHNHKDNWLEYLWKALGDERNYRRLDIFTQIAVGVLVAVGLSLAGRYVERQSYYSSLLDKYLASTEQLLIKDTLDLRDQMLKEGNPDPNATKKSAEADQKEGLEITSEEIKLKEIKSNLDSLIRASTEQTIRSLSENDGVWWLKWFNHNIERRQLLINFLRNSRLGFKNEKGKETNGAFSPLLTGLDLRAVGKDCQSNPPRPDSPQRRGCGLDLQGVDLSLAILPNAVLTQTNLRGAILNDANLSGAILYSADLRETWFRQAYLREAYLRQADLRQANLRQANLTEADLTGADLKGADLTGAIYSDGTKWPDGYDPQKSGALRIGPGAKLKGANLMGFDLREVDLKGADLTGAIYSDETKWPDGYDPQKFGALRIGPGANLKGADLMGANLMGVDLKGADLREADLREAKLDRADLTGADLTGAIYSDVTQWPDGYDPQKSGALRIGSRANLKGANLTGANLREADLREAKLDRADLTGADLTGADLTGADLTGAKGSELKGAKLCKTIGPDQIQNDRDCPPGAN
ncbi:pentapeptide repeat-containing protein [Microcystis aeruginosa BLCCF158]|uniref:Pentapeptide repeat-containing protein n=1 Tax=Microcystis aeruginosa BLCC-F158 TaxID=2755316 RepID=A0A841V268_MICAE|nr:pentapeptide repeat-containing protein [Microcystis aeruginosa]MBC1196802.1 pentapeptide repeat-containing protein [Microcystis aeruginosa BLCC-F158]